MKIFGEKIQASVERVISSPRTREREIANAWKALLLERSENGPRAFKIDMDTFAHHYQQEYGKDMPVEIDAKTITEILAKGRLAYPVDHDEGKVCHFWYADGVASWTLVAQKEDS
ncbi:hypothetical protein NTE_00874 [Candidatus Nitrososphaera evergladensis SR1]|uniref:Uncharacterized protein n=1 Tax=Candidatus Nitrososphaera evergladensis SR1 TaxID=1459636 RepID=A0A075MP63_9ARCH|nr:hypothetical protein [Candidatus Nitrososphaera evergladensis]AIF82950.1 hypothetical protein NTE_00874 [Candidatus Nitrososphaera evergladensis SR1]